MRPVNVETLKKYLQPGMRLRKVPAHDEPEELTVERKSQMACLFEPTPKRPNGFAMLWPASADARFDAFGFEKTDSKGRMLVRYEWLDPDTEGPDA